MLLFKGLMSIIKGFVMVISGLLTGDMRQVVNGFGNIFKGIGNVVISVLNGAINTINKFIKFALMPLNALISGINKIPGINIPKLKCFNTKYTSIKRWYKYGSTRGTCLFTSRRSSCT